MLYFSPNEAQLTQEDIFATILEKAPDLPENKDLITMKTWCWNYARSMKVTVVHHKEFSDSIWTPNNVKACLIKTLKNKRFGYKKRITLVKEYNRALGCCKFPFNWPDTLQWSVKCYGELPPLDREVFRNRSGYSKFYPPLLATIYLAGISTKTFPFAMKLYGDLFGCNQGTVSDLLHKLCDLGILSITKKGSFSLLTADGTTQRQCTWYCLDDRQALLNLFWFRTVTERSRFVAFFAKAEKPFPQDGWEDYVITEDWLRKNQLL